MVTDGQVKELKRLLASGKSWRWQPKTIVALLVTATAVWYSTKIRPDFRFTEDLTRNNAADKALERCETLFGGTSQVHVVVNLPSGNPVDGMEMLTVLDSVHDVLSNHHAIGDPISLVALLRSLPCIGNAIHSPKNSAAWIAHI